MTKNNHVVNPSEGGHKDGNPDEQRQDIVTITIENNQYEIHRGSQTVAEIKAMAEVSGADKLATLDENGKLKTLADVDRVTIKGNEVFRIIPGGGMSS